MLRILAQNSGKKCHKCGNYISVVYPGSVSSNTCPRLSAQIPLKYIFHLLSNLVCEQFPPCFGQSLGTASGPFPTPMCCAFFCSSVTWFSQLPGTMPPFLFVFNHLCAFLPLCFPFPPASSLTIRTPDHKPAGDNKKKK